MLLLLNGVFLAVNTFYEPKTKQSAAMINSSIPQLALLNEKTNIKQAGNKETSNAQGITETKKEPALDLKTWLAKFTAENPTLESLSDNKQQQTNEELFCYTAGPFRSKATLQQATDYFVSLGTKPQQRSIEENQYIGMLVYLPSQPSRKDAVRIAEKLAAKGVKDYMLLNEPGKRHSLSLGVYGLKKNAEKRIKTLSKLNYKAQSEARYKKNTVYWVDYAFSALDNQSELSAQRMNRLNVSQIKRNCKS